MQVLRTGPREHHDSGQVDWVPVYLCHLSLPTHIQAISLPKPCSWEKALRIMLTTVQRLIPAPWESWELLGAGRREVRRQKEREEDNVTANRGDTGGFSWRSLVQLGDVGARCLPALPASVWGCAWWPPLFQKMSCYKQEPMFLLHTNKSQVTQWTKHGCCPWLNLSLTTIICHINLPCQALSFRGLAIKRKTFSRSLQPAM